MSVFPDGSKIKTEVPVRNRRSRCRESARNNSEAQRWHSQLPPTEIELLDFGEFFCKTQNRELSQSHHVTVSYCKMPHHLIFDSLVYTYLQIF